MCFSPLTRFYFNTEGATNMQKVHVLRWLGSRRIAAVYSDYDKATQAAERANKKRNWFARLFTNSIWVVKTFEVRD